MYKITETTGDRLSDTENTRALRNLRLFIISYTINNLVSGVIYDTYVNYMQEVSVKIATSFWSFYGYATFISAFLLMAAPKTGYKKLLMLCSVSLMCAFFGILYIDAEWFLFLATLMGLVGVQLHFIMIAPYTAAYNPFKGDKEINWYTKIYYMGYVGYFISTYLGSVFVVMRFADIAGISYSKANSYTANITDMSGNLREAYLQGNQDLMLLMAICAVITAIPVLLMHEKKDDYCMGHSEEKKSSLKNIFSDGLRIFTNKDAVTYLMYWTLISFAMGLFTPYFTVFLNRNLHIDKTTSSLLVSISYIAIVLFMLMTPVVVKKLKLVGAIVTTVLTSIPFMIIIANGDMFGKYMVPAVGAALFIRSGLANITSPAESTLAMNVVAKDIRPVYMGVVNFVAALASILSGQFTGSILFTSQSGYKTAYYIAAVIYLLAAVILFTGLKKYDRENQGEEQMKQEEQ